MNYGILKKIDYMKFISCCFILFKYLPVFCQLENVSADLPISPLAAYNTEWKKKEYSYCNTAAGIAYLSAKEKEVIYIINLVRRYPLLFVNTVLSRYPSVSDKEYLLKNKTYYLTLKNTLKKMIALPVLNADNLCYESANCHAMESGKSGYIGHSRVSKNCKEKKHYMGECCDYGNSDPLEIVLSLLIDEGVPSLGHRKLLLADYTKIGVSIKSHKTYGDNTVIDLW